MNGMNSVIVIIIVVLILFTVVRCIVGIDSNKEVLGLKGNSNKNHTKETHR